MSMTAESMGPGQAAPRRMALVASAGCRVYQRADVEQGCEPERDSDGSEPESQSGLEPGYAHGIGPSACRRPVLASRRDRVRPAQRCAHRGARRDRSRPAGESAGLPADGGCRAGAGRVRPEGPASVRRRRDRLPQAGRVVLAGPGARSQRRLPLQGLQQDRSRLGVPVHRGDRAPAHRLGCPARRGADHARRRGQRRRSRR